MKVKEAKGLFKLFLSTFDYGAITMPWQTVYVRSDRLNDSGLILHESIHIEQMQREGAIAFTVKYLWYSLKYGYWNNPYEIEARSKSGHN